MFHKLIPAAATVAALCLASTSVGLADPVIEDYPAGLACPDFDLRLVIAGAPHQHSREFFDKNGNPIYWRSAGRGNSLTFINLNTGATLPLKMNGYSVTIVFHPDGSLRAKSLGHVVILLSAEPGSPASTTFYAGQIVFTVDAAGVFAIERSHGNTLDICAELSD
jgi:hypothetical protein